MDPVTILSVAAATAQFTELSFKITTRIARYAARSIELPPEIVTINHRLKALQGCVSNIETRLRNAERDSSIHQDRLDALTGFIEDLAKRCGNLDRLLGHYLPDENDTGLERAMKGFQSLSKDSDIKALSEGMAQDPVILMLSLATLDSPAIKHGHSQPAAGQVIAVVPTDRRVYNPVIRQDVIDQINHEFTTSEHNEPRVVVLQGMGGQGKTQLALEYCRQSKRTVRFNGIFWVDGADESLVFNSFAEIARKLTANEVPVDNRACGQFVKETLESWMVPWLLVIDNYDDPKSYAIQKFLPDSALGHVLITSRSQALSPLGRLVEIQGMTLEESLRLLISQCHIERNPAVEKHATAIVERLGFLPLAIAQAGAYLGEVRDTMKIGEFLEVYEAGMKAILSSTPEVWVYIEKARSPMQRDQVKNVFTTWEFSMQLLDRGQHAEEKKSFLSILAFFDISNISETVFELYAQQLKSDRPPWLELFEADGVWSTRRYAEVMTELKKLSLISSNVRNEHDGKVHVSLHPLVRDWIMLRSGQDVRVRSHFMTASQVLGYALFAHRRSEDIMGDVIYRGDHTLQHELTSHMMRRAKDHQKYLSVESFKIVGFDARLTPITLQWVLDEYFDHFSFESADLSASVWAWEHYESTNLPWSSVRCLAGIRLCNKGAKTAASDHILPDAIGTAREAVRIATQHPDDNLKEFAHFTLASRLAKEANPEDIRESLKIFQDLVCNASTVLRRCLYRASLGKLLRSTGQRGDAKYAGELFLKMYEESERSELGGLAFRFSQWPRSVWLDSLQIIAKPKSGDRQQIPGEQLAREFSHKMIESAPGPRDQGHGFDTACGQAFLGRILTQQCKYDKAIKELNACIPILLHTTDGFGYTMKVDAIVSLAHVFRHSGRDNRSVDLYLEAIKASTGLARNPSASLRQFGRNSTREAAFNPAKVYQAQGNREGVVFAANTFMEAFSTHERLTQADIIQHQSLHSLAAWGKGLASKPSDATKSTVDEVCGHLDQVLSDAVALEQRRAIFDDDTGPRAVDDSDMKSSLTTFHTHILKAHHLAEHGFSTRSIESLQASKASLDAYSSLDHQKLPMYLILVWVTLSNLRCEPGVDDTASVIRDTIAWTCIQARKFMGDDAETRAVVRKGVMRRGKSLVDHLPADEPYVEGLREEYLEQKRKEFQASSAPQTVPIVPVEAPRKSVRAAVKGFLRRHSQNQQPSGASDVKAEAR